MPTNLHEMTRDNIVSTFVEVKIDSSDDFLKVRETLTRMGIANKQKKVIYQSCHLLHKKGKYYIVHFKELFGLDGRHVVMEKEDYDRRDMIALTLEKWGMLEICGNKPSESDIVQRNLAIISHKDKSEWTMSPKYKIGKKLQKPE